MRKVIGWLSQKRSGQASVQRPRRRIDLGDDAPTYPIYAIGDVHGCLELLKEAEAKIARDIAETRRAGVVVLLGDYVDRGPASSGVLDHLIRSSEHGLRRMPLCGNHDDVFRLFLDDPAKHGEWLGLGGEQTLASYGLDVHHQNFRQHTRNGTLKQLLAEFVPDAHRQFLTDLPISMKVGQLLFVHAGIRPGVALKDQEEADLMWIRDPFLAKGPNLPSIFVIHGHTPQAEPSLGPNRIGIDTGAFYSGKLTILRIAGEETRFI
jgi:serine/threonine protein phosphatase 1